MRVLGCIFFLLWRKEKVKGIIGGSIGALAGWLAGWFFLRMDGNRNVRLK